MACFLSVHDITLLANILAISRLLLPVKVTAGKVKMEKRRLRSSFTAIYPNFQYFPKSYVTIPDYHKMSTKDFLPIKTSIKKMTKSEHCGHEMSTTSVSARSPSNTLRIIHSIPRIYLPRKICGSYPADIFPEISTVILP